VAFVARMYIQIIATRHSKYAQPKRRNTTLLLQTPNSNLTAITDQPLLTSCAFISSASAAAAACIQQDSESLNAFMMVFLCILIVVVPIAIGVCCCRRYTVGRLTFIQPAGNQVLPPGPNNGGPRLVQGYYCTGPPPSNGFAPYPARASPPPRLGVDYGQVKAML